MGPILPGTGLEEAGFWLCSWLFWLTAREGEGRGEDEGEGEGDAEGNRGMGGKRAAPGEVRGGRAPDNARGWGGADPNLDDELLDRGFIAEGPNDSQRDAGVGSRGDLEVYGAILFAFGRAEGAASLAAVAASAGAAIAGDFRGDGDVELGALGEPGSGDFDADAPAGSGRGAQGLGVDDLTERISIHV